MDMSQPKFTEFKPDPEDEKPSNKPCRKCGGPMTVGDKKAFGICLDCYCKAADEAMKEG